MLSEDSREGMEESMAVLGGSEGYASLRCLLPHTDQGSTSGSEGD
jgi:hypothetical protein